jgi:hypothetical protein
MDEQILLGDYTGDNAMAERDLCLAVSDTLMASYPGYAWGVGCTLESGMLAISLIVPLADVAGANARPGYLIRISSCYGPNGVKRVRDAGGELLERWKLNRGKAPADWVDLAWENGQDRAGEVIKSKA